MDLGLIRDIANPISKTMEVGDALLREAFQVGGPSIDTLGFTDIDDTPAEMTQSDP